jgi:hypothetical protein
MAFSILDDRKTFPSMPMPIVFDSPSKVNAVVEKSK